MLLVRGCSAVGFSQAGGLWDAPGTIWEAGLGLQHSHDVRGSCLCLSSVRHGDNAACSHELAYFTVLLNHDYQRVVCFRSSKCLKYYNNAWHFSTSKQAANSN